MRATATRQNGFRHTVKVRDHQLTVDEPVDQGGEDAGPCPQELLAASLASCTAITIEMYARRKGWDAGEVEVECDFQPAERGCPTRFTLVLRFPDSLTDEQAAKLRIVAAKCPIHRTLDGEVMFDERVERLALTG
jgi:putative redox protein